MSVGRAPCGKYRAHYGTKTFACARKLQQRERVQVGAASSNFQHWQEAFAPTITAILCSSYSTQNITKDVIVEVQDPNLVHTAAWWLHCDEGLVTRPRGNDYVVYGPARRPPPVHQCQKRRKRLKEDACLSQVLCSVGCLDSISPRTPGELISLGAQSEGPVKHILTHGHVAVTSCFPDSVSAQMYAPASWGDVLQIVT